MATLQYEHPDHHAEHMINGKCVCEACNCGNMFNLYQVDINVLIL